MSFELENMCDDLNYNSLMKDRTIYLNDDINNISIFKTMMFMDKIKISDDILEIEAEDRKPINIVINSFGGEIYECLALVSKIESFKNFGYKIITIVSAKAMSAGFFIFITGTERHMYKYATLMCHQPISSCYGPLQNQEEDIAETKRLWDILKDLVLNNTKISKVMLSNIKNKKKDFYIDSKLALELNCADIIL